MINTIVDYLFIYSFNVVMFEIGKLLDIHCALNFIEWLHTIFHTDNTNILCQDSFF
jgi:hypothetical protein